MKTRKITACGLLLALCYGLPILSGGIPIIGNMLCLMHIPVMLAGLFLGWQYGLFIGIVAPLTRSLFFGSPIFYPNAIGMAVELAIYGVTSALFLNLFKKIKLNETVAVILSLVIAMIFGRCAWGLTRAFLLIFNPGSFSFKLFIAGAFINAWPGIILQLIFIPLIYHPLNKIININ